jgi:hypothetical protein
MSMREFIVLHRPQSVVPSANSKSSPTYKLLDWLVNHWAKPTVTARDIYTYGPNSIRGGESAVNSAQTLVEQGWLIPIKTRQHNTKKWRIKRGPA